MLPDGTRFLEHHNAKNHRRAFDIVTSKASSAGKIFGHPCQVIAVVVKAAQSFFAIPLACRIHEGVIFSNRDKRTLMDKLILLFKELGPSSVSFKQAVHTVGTYRYHFWMMIAPRACAFAA